VDAAYRTSVLPGVGHFAPEEAPEQVGDLLRDWLATDGG
jgi:pimeloyl-ACP methyl ester carboxylesterase